MLLVTSFLVAMCRDIRGPSPVTNLSQVTLYDKHHSARFSRPLSLPSVPLPKRQQQRAGNAGSGAAASRGARHRDRSTGEQRDKGRARQGAKYSSLHSREAHGYCVPSLQLHKSRGAQEKTTPTVICHDYSVNHGTEQCIMQRHRNRSQISGCKWLTLPTKSPPQDKDSRDKGH